MSIKEKQEEIKGGAPLDEYHEEEFDIVPKAGTPSIKRHIVNLSLVLLLASLSFGLGRMSIYQESRVPVRIIPPQGKDIEVSIPSLGTGEVKGASAEGVSLGGEVVASKSGSKYHFPWCAGAKQISEKNKITFTSAEEARKAGYAPASNCKGLK